MVERALVQQPNNGYYVDTRGWIYYQMGEYQRARAELAQAILLVGDDVVILEHFADVLVKTGEKDRALGVYNQAVLTAAGKEEDPEIEEALPRIREKIDGLLMLQGGHKPKPSQN